MDKIDVVIPLGGESNNDNLQLRILLRSLQRYAQNLGQIYVVTDKVPKWLTNVTVLEAYDTEPQNKDANIIQKIITAADCPALSEKFIFASDDQLLTKELDLNNAPVVYNNRGAKEVHQMIKHPNHWHERLFNTFDYLQKRGNNMRAVVGSQDIGYNFEAHTFQPYRKSLVHQAFDQVDFKALPGYTVNTLYFGTLNYPPMALQDSVKITFQREFTRIPAQWKLYAGYNDIAFDTGLKYFLMGYFFEKSEYEA